MKYNELINKYKDIIKKEYKKYENMGSIELDEKNIELYKYKNILFDFNSEIKYFRIETLKDADELSEKIKKEIKSRNKPYFKLRISDSYNGIKISAYLLVHNVDKYLDDSNTYNFPKQFKEIIRIESNQKYISKIDCSIIKLYRDGILSYDQLIESTKLC